MIRYLNENNNALEKDYAKSKKVCAEFNKIAININKMFGDSDDSISLYELVELFYEAYKEFRKEYEEIGVLNLGEDKVLAFRDYVGDDNYKFFSAQIMSDCIKRPTEGKTIDIKVPNEGYQGFVITKRADEISSCLLKGLGADSGWCSVDDISKDTLEQYLTLFGRYHLLLESAMNQGIVIQSKDKATRVVISFSTPSLLERLEVIRVEVSSDYSEDKMIVDIDLKNQGRYVNYDARLNRESVKEYIPYGFCNYLLRSIKINCSRLKCYNEVKANTLVKRSDEI